MSTPKAEVASMLEALPQDASFEDIQYHLYVLEKVRRGLDRAETEGAVSNEEAKTRLGKWVEDVLAQRQAAVDRGEDAFEDWDAAKRDIRNGIPRRS